MDNKTKSELLTIKQYAELTKVSQQAVYKRLKTTLSTYVEEVEGQKYIRKAALDHESAGKVQPEFATVQSDSTNVDNLIELLNSTIDSLQEQLKTKDQQIVDLTAQWKEQLFIKDQQIADQAARYDKQLNAKDQQIINLTAQLSVKDQQIAVLQEELSKERQHSREQSDKIVMLADQAQRLQLAQIATSSPDDNGKPDAVIDESDKVQAAPVVRSEREGFFSRFRRKRG